MAQKKAHEVEGWITRPDTSVHIVLIYGPDRGLVSELSARFAAATGLPLDDPFTVVKLDGRTVDSDPGRLIDEARTVAMFAARRLIWISGTDGGKGIAEAVRALIEQPPVDVLILLESEELKKGAPLRAVAEGGFGAIALPCYADDPRALDRVIETELARENLTIAQDARQLLKSVLGGDRLASRAEVEKLALYCRGRGKVEVQDVIDACGDASASSQDAVIDAMLAGKVADFDTAFARLAGSGNPAQPLLAATLRQFMQLQQLRGQMETERKNASAAVAGARPPVFFARKSLVEGALGVWTGDDCARLLERTQTAVLESRRRPDLALAIVRQSLLATTLEAARARR